MKIRCNDCMSVFDEKYIVIKGRDGEESCPVCGNVGCLMDVEETENYERFRNVLTYNIGVPTLVNFDDGNDSDLEDAVHDIVKELRTDKKCPCCDAPLYCSDLPEYEYVCVECDENFYECEV